MNAKKCDICGTFYSGYNMVDDPDKTNGIMFLNIGYGLFNYSPHKQIDCCPECITSIKKHIEHLKTKGASND